MTGCLLLILITAATGVLNDGRIAMGTSHELIVFDPSQFSHMDMTPPNVIITAFTLLNKSLPVDSLLHLPYISLKPGENSIIHSIFYINLSK